MSMLATRDSSVQGMVGSVSSVVSVTVSWVITGSVFSMGWVATVSWGLLSLLPTRSGFHSLV